MNRTALAALVFSLASGAYWWLVGQLLPIVVPMMLNNSDMLLRVALQIAIALAFYVVIAMLFFRWLLRSKAH